MLALLGLLVPLLEQTPAPRGAIDTAAPIARGFSVLEFAARGVMARDERDDPRGCADTIAIRGPKRRVAFERVCLREHGFVVERGVRDLTRGRASYDVTAVDGDRVASCVGVDPGARAAAFLRAAARALRARERDTRDCLRALAGVVAGLFRFEWHEAKFSADGELLVATVLGGWLPSPACSYQPQRSVILRTGDLSVYADALDGEPFTARGFDERGIRVTVYGARCRPVDVASLLHARLPQPRDHDRGVSLLGFGRGVWWRVDGVVSLDGLRLLAVEEPRQVGNQCHEEPAPFLACDRP